MPIRARVTVLRRRDQPAAIGDDGSASDVATANDVRAEWLYPEHARRVLGANASRWSWEYGWFDERRTHMLFEGRIKSWNAERGFGFIEPSPGGDEIFVHVKALKAGFGRPAIGQPVRFAVEIGPHGKKRATAVERLRPTTAPHRRRAAPGRVSGPAFAAVAAFLFLFAFVAVAWRVPGWVAVLYGVASIVCAATYVVDKSASRHGRRRVSEQTLIGLGLIGGWPGAIVAQQLTRHKTTKASFQLTFRASVIVNMIAFVTCASPWFAAWIQMR